jgi:hypothetical protein
VIVLDQLAHECQLGNYGGGGMMLDVAFDDSEKKGLQHRTVYFIIIRYQYLIVWSLA